MPSPFEWSLEIDGVIWNGVIKPVLDDPRTDWGENLSLGYPFDVIREQVIEKGLADFRQGHSHPQYGTLCPDEKVLLYCFINLKKHFFAALATFQAHRTVVAELFQGEGKLFVLDIGCGPGTACLALADCFPGMHFDYVGVDLAAPMRAKAEELWGAAKARGLIGKESTAEFRPSWTDLPVDQRNPQRSALVVLSYCCASQSLTWNDLQSMANTVRSLRDSRSAKPLVLSYMNSTIALANTKYQVFKQALGLDPERPPLTQATIQYRKKRGGSVFGTEEFGYEVLRLTKG